MAITTRLLGNCTKYGTCDTQLTREEVAASKKETVSFATFEKAVAGVTVAAKKAATSAGDKLKNLFSRTPKQDVKVAQEQCKVAQASIGDFQVTPCGEGDGETYTSFNSYE